MSGFRRYGGDRGDYYVGTGTVSSEVTDGWVRLGGWKYDDLQL